MQESIAVEQQVDQHGNIVKARRPRSSGTTTKPVTKKFKTHPQPVDNDDNDDDDEFVASGADESDSSSDNSDKDNVLPGSSLLNAEVCSDSRPEWLSLITVFY